MYGMVNNALKELVESKAGQVGWRRVCRRAGVSDASFASLDPYDDSVTYSLANEAAAELNMSLGDALTAFGRFWIDFALRSAYGPLLRSSGKTVAESMRLVNGLHSRIRLTLPHLQPPAFDVRESGGQTVVLYQSGRPGLAPFVVGLLHGLADMHGQCIAVEVKENKKGSLGNELIISYL